VSREGWHVQWELSPPRLRQSQETTHLFLVAWGSHTWRGRKRGNKEWRRRKTEEDFAEATVKHKAYKGGWWRGVTAAVR